MAGGTALKVIVKSPMWANKSLIHVVLFCLVASIILVLMAPFQVSPLVWRCLIVGGIIWIYFGTVTSVSKVDLPLRCKEDSQSIVDVPFYGNEGPQSVLERSCYNIQIVDLKAVDAMFVCLDF